MRKTTVRGLLAAILLIALSFGSGNACYGQSAYLSFLVEIAQTQLPISMGMTGEMTDISINDKELIFTAKVNEEIVDIPKLKKNPSLIKEGMKQFVSDRESSFFSIVEELAKSGMNLRILYVGETSGKTVSCSLSNSELQELVAAPSDNDPQRMLDLSIQLANAQMPTNFGNGMVLEKLVREGEFIVYYYSCDESIYDMDVFESNKTLLKSSIRSELNNTTDVSIAMFKKLCMDAGVGIGYCYVGKTSGKQVRVYIPFEQLE